MTPPRLTELGCPSCQETTWVIDSDYRGIDGIMLPYDERPYKCSNCHHDGLGWELRRQSPPEFLLQPHDLYPMTQAAFDYWVDVLKAQFPHHPAIAQLGTTFVPRLPEEVAARQAAHDRQYPVAEMKDQDGARRAEPTLKDVLDWIDMMRAGDVLLLRRRDGGLLKLTLDQSRHNLTCFDSTGAIQADAAKVGGDTIQQVIRRYLDGDVAECVRQLRDPGLGAVARREMGGEAMQLNRVTWGAVSGLLGVVAASVTRQAWHAYTSSEPPRRVGPGVALGVALGLFWLADRFGLVRAAYTAPPLSLADHHPVSDSGASANTPTVPKDPPTPSGVPQEKNKAV